MTAAVAHEVGRTDVADVDWVAKNTSVKFLNLIMIWMGWVKLSEQRGRGFWREDTELNGNLRYTWALKFAAVANVFVPEELFRI